MLKLLLEKCIFAISFLTCLSLLTKLTATIIEFSVIRSSILGEKTFLPLTPSRWIWGDLRKGLLRICKDFSCFSLWFYCIINVIPIFFANYLLSCFCNSTAFSFSVVFTWYCESGILVCEFIIHPRRSIFCDTLWRYCFTVKVIIFAQHIKAFIYLNLKSFILGLFCVL